MTSDHIINLKEFPKSLVILGAGVIGCEFATIFSNFARTKVFLIDRAPRILPFEDQDIADICAKNLENKGATIHHGAKLLSLANKGDHVEYVIECGGQSKSYQVEHALISVGRVPNTESLGLELAGVKTSESGYILADQTQTSAPHIYAVGDVTFDISLVSIGEIEGRHAAERIAGNSPSSICYDNLSSIMFLDPEVAAVGINETQAKEKNIPCRVACYSYPFVNRAIAMRSTAGFVKLLVSDDEKLQILGMRALGAHASTLIESASLLICQKRPATELAEILHPHPAITEGLQECVRMLVGSSIYKPQVFKDELRVFRNGS